MVRIKDWCPWSWCVKAVHEQKILVCKLTASAKRKSICPKAAVLIRELGFDSQEDSSEKKTQRKCTEIYIYAWIWMFFSRVTECKLPIGAKSTVCRGKLNSQTVIAEQTFDMKVQYYHWIFAWSGGAVTCFSWNPVFLCQWWQRNWTVFKHVLQSIRGLTGGPAWQEPRRRASCPSWPFSFHWLSFCP